MPPFLTEESAERARAHLGELGGATCICGASVWRVRAPDHYAADRLMLEDHAGGAWRIDADAWQATRVGLGEGDLRLHICQRKHEDGDE